MQIVPSDFVIWVQKGAFYGLQDTPKSVFFGRGSASDPTRELTTLPQTPSRLGRGHPPHTLPHSAPTNLRCSPCVPPCRITARFYAYDYSKLITKGARYMWRVRSLDQFTHWPLSTYVILSLTLLEFRRVAEEDASVVLMTAALSDCSFRAPYISTVFTLRYITSVVCWLQCDKMTPLSCRILDSCAVQIINLLI